MKATRQLLRALLRGAPAGLTVLALDELAATLTLGYAIPLTALFVGLYIAPAMAVALLYEGVLLLARRPPGGGLRTFAATVGLMFAAAVVERLHDLLAALGASSGIPLAGALVGGAVACGVWVAVLRRVLARGDTASAAFLLGAASVAFGLAVNRHLVTKPLAGAALAADAAVLAAALLLAVALRVFAPRRVLAVTGALVVLALLVPWRRTSGQATAPRARPHLVLVVVDTLRQDVFRSVLDTTPEGGALRRALHGAAYFDNAIATAPWTAPSVASILTGLYAAEHGFAARDAARTPFQWRLAPSVSTLAESLRDRGYRTEALVTNPVIHPHTGIGRGFERFEYLESTVGMLPWLTVLQRLGLVEHGVYQPAATVRRQAGRHLRGAAGDGRPLFLWMHLMDPHEPFYDHPDLPYEPAAEGLPDKQRRYRAETRYTLRELTRFIELCRRYEVWDDAVFVLTSDHGETFESDGRRVPDRPQELAEGHGQTLYDELVRVPLVVRPAGGLPDERRLDVLVSLADLRATLLDLLGVDAPRLADRVSVAPWLQASLPAAPELLPRRAAALTGATSQLPQEALRTDTLKLIRYLAGGHPDELYDLAQDPGETRNRASDDPARLQAARRLLADALAKLAAAPEDGGTVTLDEDTRRRLEALGYL